MGLKRSVESRKAILADYYQGGLSIVEVAAKHKIPVGSLYHYVNTYGKGVDRGGREYDCNDGLFSEETERGKYWLGFYAADGHVARGVEVQLQLAKADRCVLEAAQVALETRRPISDSWNRRYPKSSLYVTSPELASRLLLFGPQDVSGGASELARHLVRGLFDGDGAVSCGATSGSPRVRLAAEEDVCVAVAEIVRDQLGTTLGYIRKARGIYEWQLGGVVNVQRFRDWLYKDATIFLARKREAFVGLDRRATPRKRTGAYWKRQH
jgi:transposase-like protein